MARVSFVVDGARTTVPLESNLLVVGADRTCSIVFGGPDVSPVHCELRRGADGWRVVDLESRAGTRVNGEFVNQRALRDGDVIDVGGSPMRFEADAVPPPLDDPLPVAQPMGPPPPRVAAPVSREKRPDGAPPPSREERRAARRADATSVWMIVAACVLGAALAGWLIVKFAYTSTPNHDRRVLMLEAESRLDWRTVEELAAGAESDGSFDYVEIQKILARSVKAKAAEATGVRIDQSIREWSGILGWRQRDEKKDDTEYVQRIDAYLTKYKDLQSEGTKQARNERVKITGTSATGPETGDAAWATALADAKSLESDGRFGAAIAKIEAYWNEFGSTAPMRISDTEAEKKRLTVAAERWFAIQIANAQHYFDNGERRRSQHHLETSAEKIGLPGYPERAVEAINKILAEVK